MPRPYQKTKEDIEEYRNILGGGDLPFNKKEINDLLQLKPKSLEFIIDHHKELSKSLLNDKIVEIAISRSTGIKALKDIFLTPYKGKDNIYKYIYDKYTFGVEKILELSSPMVGFTSIIKTLFTKPLEISGTKYENLYDFMISKNPELSKDEKLFTKFSSTSSPLLERIFWPNASGESIYEKYKALGWSLSKILRAARNKTFDELGEVQPKQKAAAPAAAAPAAAAPAAAAPTAAAPAAAAAAAEEDTDDLEEREEVYEEEYESEEEVMPTKRGKFSMATASVTTNTQPDFFKPNTKPTQDPELITLQNTLEKLQNFF